MEKMTDLEKFENKLLKTMQLTIDSRFAAGKRLRRLSRIGFLTTTIISLGLILIPLLTISNHNIAFSQSTLTTFQIFLAVCVLVFSVSTSTAQYELRSKDFFECADEIKRICQEYKYEKITLSSAEQNIDVKKYEKLYRDALQGTESHEDIDYMRAMNIRKSKLEAQNEEKKWSPLNWHIFNDNIQWIEKSISFLMSYSATIALCLIEFLFISDMLGLTKALTVFHTHS